MAYRLILFGLTGALLSVASAQSHQYYFVNTLLTWTEAQSVCRRDYTDLATIESTADVDNFLNTTSSYTGKAWIGLYDDTMNSWKWSLNDSSFYGPGEYSFRNWQPGQPDDYYGQQHCVQFNGSSVNSLGQWDDAGCMETMQFLCYNGTVGGSPSYVLSSISLTWTEAQKFCRENYVDLASVRNQTENEIIRTLVGASTVFIGLYREKLWSDGSDSLFRYWADGEPNGPSGDQCVAGSFNDSGRWSDESCSLSLPFVCYKPIPPNAEGFTASAQDESSITLQWNKINNSTSFVLQFNGVETFISAPVADGPVTHTVSSLSPATNYTFTLFSVLDNIRSSGISITAATAPCSRCQCCPSGTECITTNGVAECLDPCATYTVLNDAWRSTENTDYSALHCDYYIDWSGWYRFYLGQTSAQIPEKCVAENSCGAYGPMWITEPHPVQLNEIATRTVCNAWVDSCCLFPSHTIQIKRCYGYYVYKLQRPSACWVAYCTEPQPFRVSTQDESSITLQWNKINNNSSTSFILQFNGTEINITAPDGDGPVNYKVSSLTAGTRYIFTLFTVFENVRNGGEQLGALTAPRNAEGFMKSGQTDISITLQWNKINNSTSFVLLFNGVETFISAPVADGPVNYTVSSLSPATNYTFTLFSVLDNIRSSGINITAATGALLSVASAQSHQYYFVNALLTWTEAQSVCRRDYTDLATIESTADVDDFLSTSSNYTGKAWIGLYDDTLNSWTWSLNDSSFYGPGEYSFRNWDNGQPDDYYGQQHCVRFSGSSVNSLGQWDDAGCMETMEFVCYNGTVGGSPSYVLSSISLTWTEAQKFCRENYVDLASVRNQTENDIIRTLIGSSTVWIGLYREKLWSDSSDSLFRYWADGEPNNPSGDQCVAGSFNDSGRWSDESCSLSLPFVCYKPIPPNAEGFTASAQDESSITLQWNKININTSFVLLFNGVETFISAPVADGPVTHTVSSLSPATNYTFTLFSVLDNIRSSGINITAATGPCTGCRCCPDGTVCITTNGVAECLDACVNYNVLNDAWRSTENTENTWHCDRYIYWSGWYRFYLGQTNAQIPEKCVGPQRCGTYATLWINGTHPLQLNETVTRAVCDSWGGSCCYYRTHTIQIKRCYGYYIYKLQLPISCNMAYCTEPQPFRAQPFRVSTQDESSITLQWNKINNSSSSSFILQFNGTEINITAPDGDGPVNYTVSSLTAGTRYIFTLFTVFENVRNSGEQLGALTAPLNAEGFMKSGQTDISITLQWNKINNSTSFVLLFNGVETFISAPVADGQVNYTVSSLTPATNYTFTLFSVLDNIRSSGIDIIAATGPCTGCRCCPDGTVCITTNGVAECIDACVNYNVLNDAWRSTENTDYSWHCDRDIYWSGWYRFYLGQTSAQIPEKCVAERRCGTHAPLWITEPHPVQLNETVTRTVCNALYGSCCHFPTHTIQIKRCYGYYIYKLQQPSTCWLAYCTEPQPFRVSTQDESSITLQWNKINNNSSSSFILQFNGTEINITAPDGDGPVNYTVSSLTAGTRYTFTLFTVFENVRISVEQLTAVTTPRNTEGFIKLDQDESSITLQWNKINNSTSFVLQYDGVETFISSPDGDGPVNYTVSSLTAGTRYTFTLFSVFENVRSSGVSIAVVTVPSNAQNFRPSSEDESSITLQWNKINDITSFVLQFNGSETFIRSPDGDGPVTHTVSSLTAGTRYTFTLISVLENLTSSGISIAAATAPENAEGLTVSDQDESSITLQWNKINNSTSFVLQFNGIQTFISSPDGDGPVTHTVSFLTAGTRYTFTLYSVFENVRSSGVQLTAVTVPANAEGFRASEQDETSITLRWNKVGINTSFVLQFNGTETNIRAPDGDGPMKHTVTSLTARTNYTFTLFSVFENARSSGVSILSATGPNYVLGLNLKLELLGEMSESEMEDALIELFRKYNLPPQFTLKIISSKPSG
ncbi:uncharacterized protein LOC106940263 isoform X2 [Poecilia latipinna]|uniref:uncharacterized protein LOC106940263 isoform X2 n=1 Tax=Poecilia latipinna TaxID=48699 RepID=UPI00072E5672|nr:PREDICTED: uncharacterized protein LOC106940263 isoform X2 [Poecilia latipinna]